MGQVCPLSQDTSGDAVLPNAVSVALLGPPRLVTAQVGVALSPTGTSPDHAETIRTLVLEARSYYQVQPEISGIEWKTRGWFDHHPAAH